TVGAPWVLALLRTDAHALVRELREVLAERQRLEATFADVQQRDELVLHDVDQSSGGLASRGELGEPAYPHDLVATLCRAGLAAPGSDHELADDEPDHEEEHGSLDVVATVDREGVVRAREEEVER